MSSEAFAVKVAMIACHQAQQRDIARYNSILEAWSKALAGLGPELTQTDAFILSETLGQADLAGSDAIALLLAEVHLRNPAGLSMPLTDFLAGPRDPEAAQYYIAVENLIRDRGTASAEDLWKAVSQGIQNISGPVRSGTEDVEIAILGVLHRVLEILARLNAEIPTGVPLMNPSTWYAAALLADLAYYKVLPEEIDEARKGVQVLVPSEAFQELVMVGPSIDFAGAGVEGNVFTVNTRNTLAVGHIIGDRAYVAFRGTVFAYFGDWRINFSIRKSRFQSSMFGGRYHSGFFMEATRICALVQAEFRKRNLPSEIILAGHSLGGGVASIAQAIFLDAGVQRVHAVTFGAPRFFNKVAYRSRNAPGNALPVQIQMSGDLAPKVPPRIFGYVDSSLQFSPKQGRVLPPDNVIADLMQALFVVPGFLRAKGKDHYMETYRAEVEPPGCEDGFGRCLCDFTAIEARDLP